MTLELYNYLTENGWEFLNYPPKTYKCMPSFIEVKHKDIGIVHFKSDIQIYEFIKLAEEAREKLYAQSFYTDELNKIDFTKDNYITVKFTNNQTSTKYLGLNKDSIDLIISKLIDLRTQLNT